jgi:tRNA(Ile)-lysidine synthase
MPPAIIDRFRADLARVAPGTERLALAVSGGPDSMALLALAHAALPGRVVAATVDHRLRSTAADEAAMVAAYCKTLGLPHATLAPTAPIAGASIQSLAREARYALLAGWAREQGADALATAHHADDQAETFLMRAARGSGIAGLSGVRPRATIAGFPVVRPLLGWRRAELRRIATEAGAPFVDDPSNADPRYDRTRFRVLLAETSALDPSALAQSAAALAEAEEALVHTTERLWAERASGDAPLILDVTGLPRELRRRLARRAITEVRARHAIAAPAWSEAANIEPLLDSLAAGTRATQAGVMLTPRGETWKIEKAPQRRSL